jgi:Tol biopolymer transport system component
MLRRPPLFLLLASLAISSACTSDSASVTAPDVGARASSVSATALGGAITFHSNRLTATGTDYEIFVMNPDGTNVIQLTDNTSDDLSAVTSPDGSKIAFVSHRDGDYEIFVMNVDGTNQVQLTTNAVFMDATPAWSPDGSRIAFTSERSGVRSIWVMNSDGSSQTNLSNGTIQDEQPSWSPDGTRIVFSRAVPGFIGEVFVMNADGTGQTNISNHVFNDTPSDWSPDGTKILFMSNRDEEPDYQLYTMNPDGSGVARLTNSGGTDYATEGAWSPDGTRIVFFTTRDAGNWEVYVMNADGSSPVNLTLNGAIDGGASWGVPTTFVPPPPPPPTNPTNVEQCKNGGWVAYGFRNQGQCMRYVMTGQDSRIP